MCIKCTISSNVREKIAITICILNGLITIFGIALIGMAVYMKINIESRMMLLDGYDTDVLPHFLLAVGIKVVILHMVTFKIVYDCSTSESGRCVNFLFLAVMLSFILVWFLLAGGLMCFTHRSIIEESLQNGLGYVMKRYKTDMFVKVTLDRLQQEYHCCGSNGYGDWFDVNWVNEEFLNTKHPEIIRKLKGGLFFSDDVPYSCCDVTSPRPCVHHAVTDKSKHVHYGSVTLYQSGCSNVLMDFFENRILVPTGWSVISAFLLQFVTMVLMRYLQTSLADARDMGNPKGDGTGYCFPGCPCNCYSAGDPMKYVKRSRDYVEDGCSGTAPDFDRVDRSGSDESMDRDDEDKRQRRKDKRDKKEKDKKDKKRKDEKDKKEKDRKDKKGKDKKDKKGKDKKDKKRKEEKDRKEKDKKDKKGKDKKDKKRKDENKCP